MMIIVVFALSLYIYIGTLDIQEVMTMFKANGIFMSSDLLKELFKIVDEKGSGQLTLQEFKRFSMLEDASLRKF